MSHPACNGVHRPPRIIGAPVQTLVPRCGYCGSQNRLKKCGACRNMLYCSREHQVSHRKNHKKLCVHAKQAHLESMHYEFHAQNSPVLPPVGMFADMEVTRTYLGSGFHWLDCLLAMNTRAAVEEACVGFKGILKLDRGDYIGVHHRLPWLLFRLGKDGECFAFLKSWFISTFPSGEDAKYDPKADVRIRQLNANPGAFDQIDAFTSILVLLGHSTAMTLFKIRILLDLKNLQNVSEINTKLPQELIDHIKTFIPLSDIVSGNQHIMLRTDHRAEIKELEEQVDRLFRNVWWKNEHFWPILVNPGRHLEADIVEYKFRSMADAELHLGYSYDAWIETPGAIDFIKTKMKECEGNPRLNEELSDFV